MDSKAKYRRYISATCAACGSTRQVRSDVIVSDRCARCSRMQKLQMANAAIASRVAQLALPVCSCGKATSARKYKQCGACRKAKGRVSRECKQCHRGFTVRASSNSAGHFCGRPCYERWLCDAERTKHRGSRWAAISKAERKAAPFCAICGTRKRLQVHHVVPYRLTRDNARANLIPLCAKHHKHVETLTNECISLGGDPVDVLGSVKFLLRERQRATAAFLVKLKEANT